MKIGSVSFHLNFSVVFSHIWCNADVLETIKCLVFTIEFVRCSLYRYVRCTTWIFSYVLLSTTVWYTHPAFAFARSCNRWNSQIWMPAYTRHILCVTEINTGERDSYMFIGFYGYGYEYINIHAHHFWYFYKQNCIHSKKKRLNVSITGW